MQIGLLTLTPNQGESKWGLWGGGATARRVQAGKKGVIQKQGGFQRKGRIPDAHKTQYMGHDGSIILSIHLVGSVHACSCSYWHADNSCLS